MRSAGAAHRIEVSTSVLQDASSIFREALEQQLYRTTAAMAHFARALQRCSKVAGVATTTVAATAYCDSAINKKDFTPLIVARNDKIGANVHKVTLAFPAVHQSNCHRHC